MQMFFSSLEAFAVISISMAVIASVFLQESHHSQNTIKLRPRAASCNRYNWLNDILHKLL